MAQRDVTQNAKTGDKDHEINADKIKQKLEEGGEAAEKKAEKASGYAHKKLDEARDYAEDAKKSVEDYAKKNVWCTIGVAALTGAAFALLLRR